MLNSDYRDMLSAFSEERVEFLLVGAYALAAHGFVRATGDIDLWVRPEAANGVEFQDAWETREEIELDGLTIPLIDRVHLARNKEAAGRPQDHADLAWLRSGGSPE